MKCEVCGTLSGADASFCKGCGANLGVNKCSHCGDAADSDALFCSKCGNELATNDSAQGKTCQSCGFVNLAGTTYCKRCNQKII